MMRLWLVLLCLIGVVLSSVPPCDLGGQCKEKKSWGWIQFWRSEPPMEKKCYCSYNPCQCCTRTGDARFVYLCKDCDHPDCPPQITKPTPPPVQQCVSSNDHPGFRKSWSLTKCPNANRCAYFKCLGAGGDPHTYVVQGCYDDIKFCSRAAKHCKRYGRRYFQYCYSCSGSECNRSNPLVQIGSYTRHKNYMPDK